MFKNQDTDPETTVLMGLLTIVALGMFAVAAILYFCCQ